MADSTLNAFVSAGTAAARAAYTPSPPTPAAGPASGYFYFETDTLNTYSWKAGTGWIKINTVSSPSIQTVASAATVTPTFADDEVTITAQAAALAFANPTGTAAEGWGIVIRIKDNGTARAITYGSQYRAVGITLPTTTVINKTLYLGMVFNNTDTKWDVVSVAQEA